ncbi:MAG: methyltransferase domain-containing protein [Geobacter sp.]|nr:methyltransferase domain-containing protein [Geobacter sp.]
MKIAPSDGSYKTFCDIITAYRLASVMMQAVRLKIIDIAGKNGCSEAVLIQQSGMQTAEGSRFLALLLKLGILEKYADLFYPSHFSRKFLSEYSETGQRHVLDFEQVLIDKWNTLGDVLRQGQGIPAVDQPDEGYKQRLGLFQSAMHEAAEIRSKELWTALPAIPETGLIIDMGAGDGTYLLEFLKRFPRWQALACDLEEVVSEIKDNSINTHSCNLIDPQDADTFASSHRDKASIVLLSNVIHCYSPQENQRLFSIASEVMRNDGLLIVHDFFSDGNSFGAMYDLHMMINTYNGRCYSFDETTEMLKDSGFPHTSMIELQSYSHALLATRQPQTELEKNPVFLLRQKALSLGFFEAREIAPSIIRVEPWVKAKCQYGCMFYGKKWSCPPHSMGADDFEKLLGCYSKAFVVAGQPPLREFQQKLLELEKQTFLGGYKKALVFTGGPCSWCENCPEDRCSFPDKRRPSLESCGCDVFALAESCGISMKPIKNSDDFVQYIGLLLVE